MLMDGSDQDPGNVVTINGCEQMGGQTVLHPRSEAALQVYSKERLSLWLRKRLLAPPGFLGQPGLPKWVSAFACNDCSTPGHFALPDAPYLLSSLPVAKS